MIKRVWEEKMKNANRCKQWQELFSEPHHSLSLNCDFFLNTITLFVIFNSALFR